MFRPTVRDAKPLLALTALLVPWDVFAFAKGVGWGVTFAFGRWVVQSTVGNQFLTTLQLLSVGGQFDPQSRIGLYLWAVAGAIALLGAAYTVLKRGLGETYHPREQRVVGAAFVCAGVLFVLSRFFLYKWLLFSPQSSPNWFSIPLGGLYVIAVGVIFYKDWFRV